VVNLCRFVVETIRFVRCYLLSRSVTSSSRSYPGHGSARGKLHRVIRDRRGQCICMRRSNDLDARINYH
jgi:hypothetical protein